MRSKRLSSTTFSTSTPCLTATRACYLLVVVADLASLPLPDVPGKDIVAAYAKLVGKLLYICINTVPEIMYALGALTRYMTRATSY